MRRNVSSHNAAIRTVPHERLPGRATRLPWRLAALIIAALSIAAWCGIAYIVSR
jgi:hypothetical protein